MKTEKEKKMPGIMLYNDVLNSMLKLRPEDTHELLCCMSDYFNRREAREPQGEGRLIWDILKHKMDNDMEKYDETRTRRKYAVYVRERKRFGDEFLEYYDWLKLYCNNQPVT